MDMEEGNWFTVGKPKKVKSSENKAAEVANGEKFSVVDNCAMIYMSCVF